MKHAPALAVAAFLFASSAAAQSAYTVNGQPLDLLTQRYFYAIGIPPGAYWLDPQGYWGVIGSAAPLGRLPGAPGQGAFHSGGPVLGGSGQRNADGSMSYYNPNTGTGFGRDSAGCFYVGDYSNC